MAPLGNNTSRFMQQGPNPLLNVTIVFLGFYLVSRSSILKIKLFLRLEPHPLPGAAKEVKIDMTFKENIITPVVEKQIIRTYEEYTDFISDAKIWVYSLEEVAIEKTCALKKTWETRLSKQMTSLPEYDKVLREVKRSFRKARLLDGK